MPPHIAEPERVDQQPQLLQDVDVHDALEHMQNWCTAAVTHAAGCFMRAPHQHAISNLPAQEY